MKTLFTFVFSLLCLVSVAQTKISVDSVNSHKGKLVTVCEKVFGTKFLERSQLTFFDLGAPYPNAPLSIVIIKGYHGKL